MTALRAPSFPLSVLGTFLLVSTAAADEIVLRSGERLTGRIVDKSATELLLETASAGTLRISWDQIFSLQTDLPQDAMLAGNDNAPRIPTSAQRQAGDSTARQVFQRTAS